MIGRPYLRAVLAAFVVAGVFAGTGLTGVSGARAMGQPWMILHVGGTGKGAQPLSLKVWRSGEAHAVGTNGMMGRNGRYHSWKVNRWFKLGTRSLQRLTHQRSAVKAKRLKSNYSYHGPPVLCGPGPWLIKLSGRWIHVQPPAKIPPALHTLGYDLGDILSRHSGRRSHARSAAARAAGRCSSGSIM